MYYEGVVYFLGFDKILFCKCVNLCLFALEVHFIYHFRHQLEIPGKYTQLIAFYNDKKGEFPLNVSHSNSAHIPSPLSTPSTPSIELLPEMKVCVLQEMLVLY